MEKALQIIDNADFTAHGCTLMDNKYLHKVAMDITKKDDDFYYRLNVARPDNVNITITDSDSNLYVFQMSPYEAQCAYEIFMRAVNAA